MDDNKFLERIVVNEADVKELRRNLDHLRAEIANLKQDVLDVKDALNESVGLIKSDILSLAKESMNSLPKWAAHNAETRSSLVGFMGGIITGLLGLVLYLLNN